MLTGEAILNNFVYDNLQSIPYRYPGVRYKAIVLPLDGEIK